jgi:hypothetical protein
MTKNKLQLLNNYICTKEFMDFTTKIFIIAMIIFIPASLYVWFKYFKKETRRELAADQSKQTMLQAYERLTLLVSRIALPNLITRLSVPNSLARDMQLLLLQTIREEFDFNISQQIYVSTDAWKAVKTLRDQNMLIVNQIASALPEGATGGDLSKIILDFLMTDARGNLHELVSEVLANEAKKLMAVSAEKVYQD